MKNLFKTVVMIVIAWALLTACGVKSSNEAVKESSVIDVRTEKPLVYEGDYQAVYTGVVEEKQNTSLSFATMGTVSEVLVDEGQQVKKGQILARLNATNAQNSYQLALQQLDRAKDAYDRLKPMADNGTYPQIKMMEVETALKQAQTTVAMSKKNVDDCSLFAVSNGTIGKKQISAGMNVMPSTSVLSLLDITTVYIKIPVPENEINLFKKGEKATITIAAISKTITGTIKEIGVSADVMSHTYPVKIEVINPNFEIKPGMVCSTSITSNSKQKGFIVSNKALQRDEKGEQYIYVITDKKARKHFVKTIALLEKGVLITNNITENDCIVVSGQEKINDYVQINAIN